MTFEKITFLHFNKSLSLAAPVVPEFRQAFGRQTKENKNDKNKKKFLSEHREWFWQYFDHQIWRWSKVFLQEEYDKESKEEKELQANFHIHIPF